MHHVCGYLHNFISDINKQDTRFSLVYCPRIPSVLILVNKVIPLALSETQCDIIVQSKDVKGATELNQLNFFIFGVAP